MFGEQNATKEEKGLWKAPRGERGTEGSPAADAAEGDESAGSAPQQDQHRVMGGVGEGRGGGAGVSEVAPEEILKDTGREVINPSRIPEAKGPKRNGVTG